MATLFVLTVAGCASMEKAQTLPLGTVAPEFTLFSLEDREVRLADFKGIKKVVLVFYVGHG